MTARVEVFKAAFLIIGFLAIGFALGFWYARTAPLACPPPWNAGWFI